MIDTTKLKQTDLEQQIQLQMMCKGCGDAVLDGVDPGECVFCEVNEN